VILAPRGDGGFGYDPLFELDATGRTLAELSREEKSAVSHRGQAARRMRGFLERYLRRRDA
jgi:XTP/dITP diphosphohydrolase